MNTIPRFASRVVCKRLLSSLPKQPGVPEIYQNYSFKKAWLNDPSTYPMLFVMSFVGSLIVGTFIHELYSDKDLKLRSEIKHQILRDYGNERRLPFVSKVANPDFIKPEGLGVNHEEWARAKEQAHQHS